MATYGHEGGSWMSDDQRGEMRERARQAEVNERNKNKPMSELICPRCGSQNARRDRDEHEHPGVFTCGSCKSTFYA